MVSVCLPSDALLQHLLSYLGFFHLGRGISLHGCSSKAQPLLLTLDEQYLLTTAPLDLECGVAPLGPPGPSQLPLLRGVAPLGSPRAVNSREGTQLHPSTENWINDLLSMALSIRTRPSFPIRQSLPSGNFHKPLILLHQRADRLKTTQIGNGGEFSPNMAHWKREWQTTSVILP